MSHDHAQPRRRGLPRPVGALILVVLLLAVAGGAVFAAGKLMDSFGTEDYVGQGTGSVTLKVVAGDSASDIGRTLAELDVVKSADAFTEAANDDARSRGIQPGTYRLRAQMSGKNALVLLLDPKSRALGTVVVAEGLSVNEVLARVAAVTDLELPQLKAAAKNTKALGLPSWAGNHLEGLLFPATYGFEPDQDAVSVLREMVARFEQEAAALDLVERAAELDVSPYEIVTVASLAEREARKSDEYAKVSRVIYNRLDKGQRLEIDATVLYGLGRTKGGLTTADLNKETPYNTRRNVKGLPPTPIASPGTKAIEAALSPAKGDWLYYVLSQADGTQFYTSSYDAFLAQKAKSQRAGLI
jgi:UPF0755 protein